MAFNFSIQDINFDVNFKSETRTDYGFSRLNEQTVHGGNLLTYPIDLGTTDKAHYMMFTIFQQEVTNFPGAGGTVTSGRRMASQGQLDMETLMNQGVNPNIGGVVKSAAQFGGLLLNKSVELAKTSQDFLAAQGIKIDDNVIKSTQEAVSKFVNTASDAKNIVNEAGRTDATNFNRKIKRISESIALYLPDTLTFDYNQGYSDVTMYSGNIGLGSVAVSAIDQMSQVNKAQSGLKIAEDIAAVAGKNLSPFISRALSNKLDGAGKVIASTLVGGVENPMLELLYTAPEFRNFRFDFMLYPRSQAESDQVYRIINAFKFHSAPEIKPGSAGYFLVPPSVFNIEFYYNGKKNENLPLLSDCVCTGVSVDYAPSGWAAYEVPGSPSSPGGTGSPFAVRLTLSFKETVILTKGLYHQTSSTSRQRDNR